MPDRGQETAVAVRWRDPTLRPRRTTLVALTGLTAPAAAQSPRPSRWQAVALLSALVVVAGCIAAVSFLVRPDRARAFSLLHGSLFLSDSVAPVAVDLASGRPTVRLVQAAQQVGARTTADLSVTPLQDGTLLLDRRTGEFNMVAPTGFVVKTTGGVPIPPLPGSTGVTGVASGQQAYLEQTGPTGTAVYLVSESTVQTAGVATGKVRPRAVRSMPDAGSTAPGASASADGDLWLLVGSGATRTVRRLHLPADSSPGVTLASSDHGTVPAVSAIEAAGTRGEAPDTGPAAVGVASADAIRLVSGRSVRTVRYPTVAGADTVLAAGEATGRLAFLIHGTGGWYALSVATDGSQLRGPTRLAGIAAGADLGPPAMSEGNTYTVDRSSGRVYRIDSSGRTSALSDYPLFHSHGTIIEPGGFGDAYVIARGSRVIVNSPSHLDALVLFTDGSHDPLTIEKSTAVAVSASGGADALTRSRHADAKNGTDPKSRATQRKQKVAPITNQVDCRDTRQKPHIPSIVGAEPGSRSVALTWTYPTPDPQDCRPSTYVVGVTLISDDAPSPPGSVRVQGQTSVNLAGLFPSTRYQVTVTAYINGQGTPSAARLITTGPAGPAAPVDVSAAPDDAGNWDISWRSCGTVAQGCVVSASWQVIPEFCDGRGLSGAPAPLTGTADPTTAVQPPAQLVGGDALLGRGVRFQVEGIGEDNAVGTPSSYTACTYSWSPPVASGITVSASTPPTTGAQQTTRTTATVRFADGAVHDLGGVGGTLTYDLLDSNGDVVATRGPTADASVSLGGIVPGAQYSVRVVVTPPRHPGSAVTLPTVDVEPALATWPTPAVTTSFQVTDLLHGTLSVSFQLPGATALHGETFDLTPSSRLVCGSTSQSLNGTDVAVGTTVSFGVDRTQLNGSCQVELVLDQNPATATSPVPLFGSGDSPQATTPVTVVPPSITTTQGDFAAQWGGTYDDPQITVRYTGTDLLGVFANNWRIAAGTGSSSNCGSSTSGPDTTFDVNPSCVAAGGTIVVSVGYSYLGQNESFGPLSVAGNPPDPVTGGQVDFTAAWGVDPLNPAVQLTYTGSASRSDLQNLTWTETVTSNNVTCGSATANPGYGDPSVDVDYTACPVTAADGSTNAYTVSVTFSDPTYGGTGTYGPVINGTPP